VWVILLLATGAGGYYFWGNRTTEADAKSKKGGKGDAASRPSPVVGVTARKGDMPMFLNGLGNVTAFYTVTVRTRVDGQIMKVHFEEGQSVKEGDLLIEIDPRPFQAAVDQAQGQLAQANGQVAQAKAQLLDAQARLVGAEANQEKTQLDADRYVPLAKQHAITQQEFDNATQNNLSARAQVEAAKAQTETARAQTQAANAAVEAARAALAAIPQSAQILLHLDIDVFQRDDVEFVAHIFLRKITRLYDRFSHRSGLLAHSVAVF